MHLLVYSQGICDFMHQRVSVNVAVFPELLAYSVISSLKSILNGCSICEWNTV